MPGGRGGGKQPAETRAPSTGRGKEYQAEKLTGNRAQAGNLHGGKPRWTYEVKWAGSHIKNTYEPASYLIGWD